MKNKLLVAFSLAALSVSAQAAIGSGKVSVWGGKCNAQTCTLSGESGTIKATKNADTKYINVIGEGCLKLGFEGGVLIDVNVGGEACAKLGYTKTTSDGTEYRVTGKTGWSYTYAKNHNIQVTYTGNKTTAKIIAPTTRGRPAGPSGY